MGNSSSSGCESGGENFCAHLLNANGCVSIGSNFQCSCKAGYTPENRDLNSTCADVDECIQHPAICQSKLLNSYCVNTPGSYDCKCREHTERKSNACEDVNKCLVNKGGCAEFSDCINNPGATVTCQCWKGYSGNDGQPGKPCEDVDECTDPNVCDESTICVNTLGSYRCDCKPGFQQSTDGKCERTSICGSGEDNCDPIFAVCTDVPGSYTCSCKEGFEGSGLKGRCTPLPGGEDLACKLLGVNCGAYQKCVPDEVNAGKYKCKDLPRGAQFGVLLNNGLSSDTPVWLWGCVAAGLLVALVTFYIAIRVSMKRFRGRRRYNEEEVSFYGAGYGYDYGAAETY